MSQKDLVNQLGGKDIRLIRRLVITQSTGKRRASDDASGEQSEASTDDSSTCPLGKQACTWKLEPRDANALEVLQPTTACSQVFQVTMDSFWLAYAVTSFNRWSRFSQALARRLPLMLFSMYFDDATMQDWKSEASHSQACVADLMKVLGSPWSPAKTQACGQEGDFLGLMHDVSRTDEGIVRFWPRESLVDKVLSIIKIAREVRLPAGVASKLYGVSNFIETGMFGRIGRAGLWAIKDRQKETVFELTPPINLSFELLSDLFKLRPSESICCRTAR